MKIKCSHTKLVNVSDLLLIQNPKNANKHSKEQVERLAKIINFQGQRSPIVISNRSGFVTKGHGRLLAIEHLGWDKAAVDYQDYQSEAEEYADMIADNEIARWAEFDIEKVKLELQNLDIGDVDLIGLKDKDLEFFKGLDTIDLNEYVNNSESYVFSIKCESSDELEELKSHYGTIKNSISFNKFKGDQ